MTAIARADDVIFVADPQNFSVAASLAIMLQRLGLSPVPAPANEAEISITFTNTAFSVLQGAPAEACFRAASALVSTQVIGAVSNTIPEKGQLIALRSGTATVDAESRLEHVRRLCVAAAMIGEACQAQRLYWPPAGLWSPMQAFADAVIALEGEGLPPILHLVAFVGDAECLQTRGLAHFCGVELQLHWAAAPAVDAAVRRLARLAIHAMVIGPPAAGAVLAGLEPSEQLTVGAAVETGGVPVIPVRISGD